VTAGGWGNLIFLMKFRDTRRKTYISLKHKIYQIIQNKIIITSFLAKDDKWGLFL